VRERARNREFAFLTDLSNLQRKHKSHRRLKKKSPDQGQQHKEEPELAKVKTAWYNHAKTLVLESNGRGTRVKEWFNSGPVCLGYLLWVGSNRQEEGERKMGGKAGG